jgi:pimeloyl-ACP methyl ester carboxylesterase
VELEVNGYRMHFALFGDPAGEPVLWISGWSGTGEDWQHIFKEVPAGFQVVGPDLQGNGASTGHQGKHSFRQSARDIFALLDHLGIHRVKGVGLSGGGIILLHMATQQPDRIEAMITISAPPYFPPQARAIQRQFSFAALDEAEKIRLRERCKGGQEQIDWLVEQSHAMAETYDDVDFTPPLLGTITARTLIVFGDIDPLYPVRLAFELREAIPRSSLWVVPNGGDRRRPGRRPALHHSPGGGRVGGRGASAGLSAAQALSGRLHRAAATTGRKGSGPNGKTGQKGVCTMNAIMTTMSGRTTWGTFLAAAILTGLAALAGHAQTSGDGAQGGDKTLTGVVSDAMCGRAHMMKSKSDAECLRVCVKNGTKYALVSGETVYTLEGHEAELDRYAAQEVTVTGKVTGSSVAVNSVTPSKKKGDPAKG